MDILYIEDEQDTRERTTELLSLYDHKVTAVSSVGAALAAMEQHPFDLVITDYDLKKNPTEDKRYGLEFVKILRERELEGNHIPAILISAQSAVHLQQDGWDLDALKVSYLSKPFNVNKLMEMIEHADHAHPPATRVAESAATPVSGSAQVDLETLRRAG